MVQNYHYSWMPDKFINDLETGLPTILLSSVHFELHALTDFTHISCRVSHFINESILLLPSKDVFVVMTNIVLSL